jgi:hypothetical protein
LEEDVNCLVVPPRDAAAIAAAVRRLSESPRLRERLVAGGRQTATRLTIDLLTDVMEQWHRSTIERTARKRAAS